MGCSIYNLKGHRELFFELLEKFMIKLILHKAGFLPRPLGNQSNNHAVKYNKLLAGTFQVAEEWISCYFAGTMPKLHSVAGHLLHFSFHRSVIG